MINIYSKSDNELGRFLSNFTYSPFKFDNQIWASVEAYWFAYPLFRKLGIDYCNGVNYYDDSIILKDIDYLRNLYGYKAKQEGHALHIKHRVNYAYDGSWRFIYKNVCLAKITQCEQKYRQMLIESTDDFEHYYQYGTKKVYPAEYQWTAIVWKSIREELQNPLSIWNIDLGKYGN